MIFALYASLGQNMWTERTAVDHLVFDEEAWEFLINEAKEAGINTIFLDVGEGMEWHCRPEISVPGAWSHEKVKEEVLRLREMGIDLYPKLNFSACHHLWLGEYRKMMCTPVYYEVVKELIGEVYDAFLQPKCIHLGMDEEGMDTQFNSYSGYQNYRRGDIYWHDFNYILNCAREVGATPWVWWDAYWTKRDEFMEKVDSPRDLVLCPWCYTAIKEEHFTRLEDHWIFKEEVKRFPHTYQGRTYCDDNSKKYKKIWQKAAEDKLMLCPCGSACFDLHYSYPDLFEYFHDNYPEELLFGFMAAPWKHTLKKNMDLLSKDLCWFKAAKRKYYN